ncbi:MAG: hypothetical protein QGG36_11730 [Pirellulaceae bacterium]|jgi:membrane protein implicated in regulation of membrane protease activity|nr:hypothetical protein [Pirellulaceae bacterium]
MSNEMDSPPPSLGKRCCICLLVLSAFLYLALDGHHTKANLLFPGDILGNPLREIDDNITWMHGWPVACYVRNSLDTVTINSTPGLIDTHAKELQFSCFPFDDSPPLAFSAVGLIIDSGALILLLTGLWMTLRTTRIPRIQFSVRSLLITMAVFSLLLATKLLFFRPLLALLAFLAVSAAVLFCLWRAARSWAGQPRNAGTQTTERERSETRAF